MTRLPSLYNHLSVTYEKARENSCGRVRAQESEKLNARITKKVVMTCTNLACKIHESLNTESAGKILNPGFQKRCKRRRKCKEKILGNFANARARMKHFDPCACVCVGEGS